jgi:tripartite-type tricarboxylate transporter receptor subunit TctC
MKRGVWWLVLLAVLVAAGSVTAQEPFPSRPLQIVVPFPPGGVADLHARPIAPVLERILKQPIAVVNKSGAAGAVGMQFVATSKPDGYTLLLALSSISIIPEVDRLFARPPAYTRDQLAPIALLSADPTVLVVKASSPWKSMADLVADAKRRPGAITFSSSGVYGTLHMAMELLSHAAGIKLRHVPYAGGGPAVTALLGGHVDALASGPSVVIPHLKAGTLRALAGWGDKRLAALPDVPTLKELGYEAEFYIWAGLFAPKGTPAPVMHALRDAARQAVADPEFKGAMAKLETPIHYLDAEEFQKFWDKDAQALAEGVKRVGRIEQ